MLSHLLRYQSSAAHNMLRAGRNDFRCHLLPLFLRLAVGICIDKIRQNRTGILRSCFPWDYQHIGVKK